jgi:hypothetical protein
MPIADAIADAETLRLNATRGRAGIALANSEWHACIARGMAGKGIRAESAAQASASAHFAFRAVPELRG